MSTFATKMMAGATLALLAGAASAQDPTFLPGTDPMDFAQRTTNWTNTLIGNHMVQQAVERNNRGKGRSSRVVSKRMVPAGAPALGYRPDPAIREAAKRAFVARIAKMNPAVGPKLTEAMKSFDMFAHYSKMVGEEGYRRDNVADALASTIVEAWVGSKGKIFETNNEGQRLIRSQIATALLADPRFKNAAFRQRLGDEMQLTTVFLLSGLTGAIQQGRTAGYGRAMAALFKGMTGTDASRVKLTSNGFVRA